MPLRVLVFQHHPTSPPGILGARMAARGVAATMIDAQHGATLPLDAASHDGLLILGGAMNAYADTTCSHFPELLELARFYAAAGKPVLGICLGAQLLARAWGATVHLGTAPEFGVVPLHGSPAATEDPLLAAAPAVVPAMQWHDDTFDLPEGAVPLLTGRACRNQAFRVADVVYGFQCHFETDRRDMVAWAVYRRDVYGHEDLTAQIAEQVLTLGQAAEEFGRLIADCWLDLVATRAAQSS